MTNTKELRNALRLLTDNVETTTRIGDTFSVVIADFPEPLVFSMEFSEAMGSVAYRLEQNRFFQVNLYIACGDRNIFTWGAQDLTEDAHIFTTFETMKGLQDTAEHNERIRTADNNKVILNRLIK